MFIFHAISSSRTKGVHTLLLIVSSLAKWTVVEENPEKGQFKDQC